MTRLTFSLNVSPAGKERPRVTRNGTFMPKKYEAWRHLVTWQVRSQVPPTMQHLIPLTGRIAFSATFSVPKGEMKPDLDNAMGAIWDAIQVPRKGGWGLIQNDKQIVELGKVKVISGPTKIIFSVEEIE